MIRSPLFVALVSAGIVLSTTPSFAQPTDPLEAVKAAQTENEALALKQKKARAIEKQLKAKKIERRQEKNETYNDRLREIELKRAELEFQEDKARAKLTDAQVEREIAIEKARTKNATEEAEAILDTRKATNERIRKK